MVINKKRIRPSGNNIPCHILHDMTVIAGLADFHIANPTATLVDTGVSTVMTAQPVYSAIDQDSAKSGIGPSKPPPKPSRRVRPWERENLTVECQGKHPADDHDEGRSPRSSPRAGKPSTWRRGAVRRDGGCKGNREMNRGDVMIGMDTFTGFDQIITKERDTKATETTMTRFRRGTMPSRRNEASMGESYPCDSAKC